MNVDHIKDEEVPSDFSTGDRLDLIFARQHHLTLKYIPIETSNGLRHSQDCPVNLDDRFGQAQLKDMFWRVTEELTEAVDAYRRHAELINHTLEELSDALHFLVEAYLLSDITPIQVAQSVLLSDKDQFATDKLELIYPAKGSDEMGRLDFYCYQVIHQIGCASNCLKQRPWKQTHQLVDKKAYRRSLLPALPALLAAFRICGLTADETFRMYWKKSLVNTFRIRSNY